MDEMRGMDLELDKILDTALVQEVPSLPNSEIGVKKKSKVIPEPQGP